MTIRDRRTRGLTLLELLMAAVVVGLLAIVGAINYFQTAQTAQNREADAYLQMLRQAALAYHETWNAYPTDLTQVPQVMVPAATNPTSRWTYTFSGTAPTSWTTPTATSKDGGRQRQILQNGTIQ